MFVNCVKEEQSYVKDTMHIFALFVDTGWKEDALTMGASFVKIGKTFLLPVKSVMVVVLKIKKNKKIYEVKKMGKYTKDEILKMVENAIIEPNTFYKQPFLNYKGDVAKEKYSEIVSKYLNKNLKSLESISTITRDEGYYCNHKGETPNEKSNRHEERIALSMFGKTYDGMGKILDYQIPLKNKRNDIGIGKIDLISYNNKMLYLLELKEPCSNESLLRAVVEIYTYYKIINHQKLIDSYKNELSADTQIKKAVLIFENSRAHKDYEGIEIKKLMKNLDVELFVIEDKSTYNIKKL